MSEKKKVYADSLVKKGFALETAVTIAKNLPEELWNRKPVSIRK